MALFTLLPARSGYAALSARLLDESRRLGALFQRGLPLLLALWAALALLGGLVRIAVLVRSHPALAAPAAVAIHLAPYLLIAVAPAIAVFLVSRAFPNGAATQHAFRLSPVGHWQELSAGQARSTPGYGVEGWLVSLAGGMLLAMVMRLGTFLLAMPAMPPGTPAWALAAFRIMAFDVAFLGFMYAACFTMALRAAPLFPRMLLLTWSYDLLMQLAIAKHIAAAGPIPAIIAQPFAALLEGNVRKVLITVAIWLPYLILSHRVNVTFRHRIRYAAAHPA